MDNEQAQRAVEIANTIKQQILAVGGNATLGSWGAHEFAAMPEEKRDGVLMRGGLRFKVTGRLFKGYVTVFLAADDTYTVQLVKPARRPYHLHPAKLVEEIGGVYWDNLAWVIDSHVETPAGKPQQKITLRMVEKKRFVV